MAGMRVPHLTIWRGKRFVATVPRVGGRVQTVVSCRRHDYQNRHQGLLPLPLLPAIAKTNGITSKKLLTESSDPF